MREQDTGSLRARVFRELENAIISREYREGDALNEIRLSEQFGVSRTPVREALMQLELEGLVRTIPNKGAVVVGVSEQDVADIYDIRLNVEGYAIRRFAERATEADVEELGGVVELQEFYLQKQDMRQIWLLDTQFHRVVYDGCGNRTLGQMLIGYHNCIKRARDLSLKTAKRAAKSVAEHRAIWQAVRDGDAAQAEKLMLEHIRNARENFTCEVAEMNEPSAGT
ncbi:MAG: GntR family transcriptional regulator [Clostridia bacterium]|nr:GntR family transcriptional regulator [Clostridia bacterium]